MSWPNHLWQNNIYILGITVSLEESGYNTTEGQTVGICASITSGSSAVPVNVDVITAGGSAQRKKRLPHFSLLTSYAVIVLLCLFKSQNLSLKILCRHNLCFKWELPEHVPVL